MYLYECSVYVRGEVRPRIVHVDANDAAHAKRRIKDASIEQKVNVVKVLAKKVW